MDINEIISRINLKIIIRIAVAAAAFILLLIFAGMILNRAAEKKYYSRSADQAQEQVSDLPDFSFGPDDLKFPPEYSQTPEFKWRPFRRTPEKWSSEEIKRFWKDPADVIIEVYADENREYIEKILEDVP